MTDNEILALIRVWRDQRETELARHSLAFMQITWDGRWDNPLLLPAAHKSLERFAWFMWRILRGEQTG